MNPGRVVEPLDVLEDRRAQLCAGRPAAHGRVVQQCLLGQGREERLRDGVVEARADGAHRLRDPGVVAGLPERQTDELPAVIGMMDRSHRGSARRDGHLQRVDDELLAHVRRHAPADDPAAEEILHRGEVQPALTGPDLLDVGRPHPVGRVRSEVAADEVTERLNAFHAGRAALPPPTLMSALKTRQRHQPDHPILADPDPLAAQHRVHPRAPVPATAGLVDRADPLGQPRVLKLTIRRRPTEPRVVPGLGHAEQLALQGDRMFLGLLGFRDMPVHSHRVSVSRAKKAVACLRMSRSCLSRAFSRRSRRSSSRSAELSASSRSPTVRLVLAGPVTQRLLRDPQRSGDVRERPAVADQLHRLTPELLRVRRS